MNYISTCPNICSFLVEGKAEDKNDVCVKKKASKNEKDEIMPITNTANLPYHDVLVKERVNENKNKEDFMDKRYKHEKAVWDLICKGMEAISLLPESPVNEYDSENENLDDLPDGSKERLSDTNSCGRHFVKLIKIQRLVNILRKPLK